MPRQALLFLLICAPFAGHAQGVPGPAPAGHDMSGGPHGMMMMQEPPAATRDGGPSAPPGAAEASPASGSPADHASPKETFAPNVTGPGLAPSISEAQANEKYGVESVLAAARANTSQAQDALKKPVGLDVSFRGPLWVVKRQKQDCEIRGFGIVEINEDTLHDAVITQSGVVQANYVFPGMEVKAGDPLISIFSPERVNAQHMFLADFSKDEGNQASLTYYSSFSSTQKYLDQSRSNLKWWGFSDADIESLLKTKQIKNDYVFRADQDSYILATDKNTGAVVVAGDKSEENFVIPGERIMQMARLDTVWGMSFVNPEDDRLFQLGDTLVVTVGEGGDAKPIQGLIVHKHDNAIPATRKADFHVLLPNEDRRIAPGSLLSFAKRISLDSLWIPRTSLLYADGRPTVIRRGANGFEAVDIAIGVSSGALIRVVEGLNEGDQLVAAPRAELDPDARLAGFGAWN